MAHYARAFSQRWQLHSRVEPSNFLTRLRMCPVEYNESVMYFSSTFAKNAASFMSIDTVGVVTCLPSVWGLSALLRITMS